MPKRKRCLPFIFFLSLGAISLLGQVVLLRELNQVFYGNELFYGLGLGFWFLTTGLGSLLAIKFRIFQKPLFLWLAQLGLVVLLPFSIIVLRLVMAGIVPLGELPQFWISFLVIGLTLTVYCFPLGMLFPWAVTVFSPKKDNGGVSFGYFWETLGFAAVGLIFSLFLAETSFPLPSKINFSTLKFRFPQLVKTENSKFGQIAITQNGEQQSFFINGRLSFVSEEAYENQKLIALIKPFLKNPGKVLTLTSPLLANELYQSLSQPDLDFASEKACISLMKRAKEDTAEVIPQRFIFVEIDATLLALEKNHLTPGITPTASDPRRFLNQTTQKYDLILISLGNPQTLFENRYFTQEFFLNLKRHLTADGILAVILSFPIDYQSQEALNFGATIFHTLQTVFPSLELFTPENQLLFLAGSQPLQVNEDQNTPTWQDYFAYEFGNRKRTTISEELAATPTKINTDFEPVAFFYQQLFWQTMFSFKMPQLILKLAAFLPFILLLSVLAIFILSFPRRRLSNRPLLGAMVACSSFILVSLEILILLIFQTKIGYLYSQISLLLALVLLGIAFGTKFQSLIKAKAQTLLTVSFAAFLFILCVILGVKNLPLSESLFFWLGMIFAVGIVHGMIFVSLSWQFLKLPFQSTSKNPNPGYLYAFDLFGGSLGAILTSTFLLPFLGVENLSVLLGGITLVNLVVVRLFFHKSF